MEEPHTSLIDNGLKFKMSENPKVEICSEEVEKRFLFKGKIIIIDSEESYLNRAPLRGCIHSLNIKA